MQNNYKKVPALEKCFAVLELLAGESRALGISDIASTLDLNKSTIFNMVHTLAGLGILYKNRLGKFELGSRLYLLGMAAGRDSGLIQAARPHLEKLNRKTGLSIFLGVLNDDSIIIVDKADSVGRLKISSEIGMRLPLNAGASGLALLSLLGEVELHDLLDGRRLKKHTSNTCVGEKEYLERIARVRRQGIAYDWEEYLEGIVAMAVPLHSPKPGQRAAIWAVGLRQQLPEGKVEPFSQMLLSVARELDQRFGRIS